MLGFVFNGKCRTREGKSLKYRCIEEENCNFYDEDGLFVEMRFAYAFFLIKICLEHYIRGMMAIPTWSTLQIRKSHLSSLFAPDSLCLFCLIHSISTVGYYYCIATDSRICWNAQHYFNSVLKEILGSLLTIFPFTL